MSNQTQKGRFTITNLPPTKPAQNQTEPVQTQTGPTQTQTGPVQTRITRFASRPQINPQNTNSSPSFSPPMASSFFSPQQFQTPSQFQNTQQFQLQQIQAPQQVQTAQLLLYTKENKSPAGWGTKWEDLHPDSQKVLLQIEERIREYRDESEKLDQCNRLYESSISNDSFELDASHIIQELGNTSTSIDREKLSIQKLSTNIKEIMRNTELAIHSYMLLRSRFAPNPSTNQIMPAVPVLEFYNGYPKRPSVFLEHTVERLRKFLEECVKWIEEVEQLVQIGDKNRTSGTVESLPKVMSNLHDYFIYVASKVENLHQYTETMKQSYLTEQRRRGDYNSDPFLEANRREAARRAAAAMRVHPTLHLPPATPSAAPPLATPNPTPQQPQQTPQQTPLIGSGLFSTPIQQQPTNQGSTPFGSGSASSLFGSTAGPTGFGATPQSAIAGSNLFATPAFGGAGAAGASFGGNPKATRPKTRTGRR